MEQTWRIEYLSRGLLNACVVLRRRLRPQARVDTRRAACGPHCAPPRPARAQRHMRPSRVQRQPNRTQRLLVKRGASLGSAPRGSSSQDTCRMSAMGHGRSGHRDGIGTIIDLLAKRAPCGTNLRLRPSPSPRRKFRNEGPNDSRSGRLWVPRRADLRIAPTVG